MDAEQLRNHFDRHAISFDLLYSPEKQSRLQRWLNRHFHSDISTRYMAALEHVRKSDAASVLDVGCGPGHYLAALAQQGVGYLVGIDVSLEMIEMAKRHPNLSQSTTVLIHGDFATWQFDQRFDVILALGFFDYVLDPVPILKKMKGLASHSVFASFPSRHWFRTPFRWTRRRLQGTKVYFYSPTEIEQAGLSSGFSAVTVRKLPGAGMNYVAVMT